MFGECSFTPALISLITISNFTSFRPHVWGMFFHLKHVPAFKNRGQVMFSSPCLGNVLSHEKGKVTMLEQKRKGFSSPCLGNVLSPENDTLDELIEKNFDEFSSPCLGNVLSQWLYRRYQLLWLQA